MSMLHLALCALCSSPIAGAQGPLVEGEIGARADELLERLSGHGFSGVVALALEGEPVLVEAYGEADRVRDVAMTVETAMPLGSVSKHFTAAAVLRLEADGALGLGDPLEAFFEEVPADKRGITLHQLLCHMGGFAEGGPHGYGERDAFVRAALATELVAPPGTRFSYSNIGYALLAGVVEVVSGAPFEQFLIDELFDPLEMHSTGAVLRDWPADALAHGTIDGEDVGTKPDHLRASGGNWGTLGAGGLSSTAGDMARWTRALGEGAALPLASVEAMTTPHASMGPDMGYGYGCGISVGLSGWKRVGHTGSDDIFSAVWRWFPERGAFLFVAGNDADAYVIDPAEDLERLMSGGEVELAPAVIELSPDVLANYTGTWRLDGGGALQVEAGEGTLALQSGDFELAGLLHPVRRDQESRRVELAESLVAAFERAFAGELEQLRLLIDPYMPAAEFEGEHAELFDAWTAELGGFEGASAAPGRNRFGEIALVCTLTFEDGARRIEYSFGEREVGSIRMLRELPRRLVRPLSAERFMDYDALPEQRFELRFRLDKGGRATALWLTGTDGEPRVLSR